MLVRVEGQTATVQAETAVYSLSALKKAAYRHASRCNIIFGPVEGSRVSLEISCPQAKTEADVRELIQSLFEEALDYDLRERLSAETAPLRNLILAHAYSRTKLTKSSDG